MQNHSDGDNLCSKTISFLRFPLIALVVLIHTRGEPTGFDMGNFQFAELVCGSLVRKGIASIAVPLFFFISGFLYFYKSEFTQEIYQKKLVSRVKTLVVPFLLWTALTIAYVILVYKLGLTRSSLVAENHTLMDWVKDIYGSEFASWAENLAFPLCFQFWFIRDLFIVGVLSPLWYFLIKRFGVAFVIGMAVLWFVYRGHYIPGLSLTSVFFFCAGAYFSIKKIDFVETFSRVGVPVAIFVGCLVVAFAFLRGTAAGWWLSHAFICAGCAGTVFLVSRGIKCGLLKESKLLTASAFFVYAFHCAPYFVSPLNRVLEAIWVPATDAGIIAMFFVLAASKIGISVLAFCVARKIFPKLTALFCGGRIG